MRSDDCCGTPNGSNVEWTTSCRGCKPSPSSKGLNGVTATGRPRSSKGFRANGVFGTGGMDNVDAGSPTASSKGFIRQHSGSGGVARRSAQLVAQDGEYRGWKGGGAAQGRPGVNNVAPPNHCRCTHPRC